jgi:hypothetical protein
MSQKPSWLAATTLLLLLAGVALVTPAPSSRAATPTPEPTQRPARPTATPYPRNDAATPTARPARPTTDDEPAPALRQRFEAQDGDRITYINEGVIHIARYVPEEPWNINLLLFDMTRPEFRVKAGLGDGWLSGRTRTSYLVAQNRALAGINGDLFNSVGVPQGLMLVDGQVAIAPKHRATFAWSKAGEPFIGYFTDEWTWRASVTAPGGEERPIQLLNWPCDYGQICMFNHFAQLVPAEPGDVKVLVGPQGKVYKIVEGKATTVPTGTTVLRGTGDGAEWLLEQLALDDRVEIRTATEPPLEDFSQAISGGPIILREGEFVQDCMCTLGDCRAAQQRGPIELGGLFDEDDPIFEGPICEDFDFDWKMTHYFWSLMPRVGLGFDEAQQTMIVALVDGYQPGFSRGMTQEEFAELLLEFGASEAMEFDGGGSATMVLEDSVLNQPSDQSGERYVANGLLFFWDDLGPAPQVAPELRGE